MLAVFTEFDRDIIQQRTRAGLEIARKSGRVGGNPPINDKKEKVNHYFVKNRSLYQI